MSVGILLEGSAVASLRDSNDMGGRLELEMLLNNIWIRVLK